MSVPINPTGDPNGALTPLPAPEVAEVTAQGFRDCFGEDLRQALDLAHRRQPGPGV